MRINYKIMALLCLMLSITGMKAQFSGLFTPANWGTVAVNSDGITNSSGAPASIYMVSGDNSPSIPGSPGTNDYTITVPATGTISFSWGYTTVDGSQYDYPQYTVNGVATTVNGYVIIGGSTTQSGNQTCIPVTAGQVFGFRMYTVDNYAGAATTTFSNFLFTTGPTITPVSATVCPGGTVALTATGGGPFSWSNGITNGVAFTPTASQVYTVTTGNSFCLITKTASVIYNPPLSILGPTSNVCANSSVTLTASGGSTYSWSTGGTATSEVVVPTANTTYTVYGTSSAGCNTQGVKTLSVDPGVPVVTATSSSGTGVCPGKTLTLNGIGATTYTWVGTTPTVTNGVSFSLTATTPFTVTGGNSCGTATAAITISIHPLPGVTAIASTQTLCSGNPVTLTGVGSGPSTPTAYAWSGGAGGVSNGVAFSPVLTATYTVVGTSALSCTNSAAIAVTVIITPSIAPTAQPALICLGKSSTLTATGAASYTWMSSSQTVTTPTLVATPTSSGISTYTVIRANGVCTTTQQISVVTNSLPGIFAFVQPTLVCALNPATISIGGGQTYTWTSPGNPPASPSFTFSGSTPVVYPPVPTTYTAAASDGTCINVTTVFIPVNPNPTITTSPSTPSICNGQTVSVSATGANNYTWTATSFTQTQTGASITDSPTISASYMVTGDNSFGCTSIANQIVVVYQNPVLTTIQTKTLVCSGGPSTITANGADTYVWTHNSAPTKTIIVNPTNTITGPVEFTVVGTYSATGCNSSKTVAVTVFVPTITVTGNTNTCAGGLVNLTALAGPGVSNNYKWYITVGGPSYNFAALSTSVAAATVFTVTAQTTSLTVNCPSTKTVDIGIYFNPTITAVAQRTTICVKESVVLTATGGATYLWSNNSQQTQTISVSPNSNASYTVTGTDANGCVNTGTVSVKVSGCVGINELNTANIGLIIYPNPNNGEFVVKTGTDITLNMVNDLGQIVRTVMVSEANDYKVSVSDLSGGIYFITGQKDGVQINQKVVVAK